jgi:hypothetical protein
MLMSTDKIRTCFTIVDKGKGKVHPRTGHEGPEVKQRYSCTLSLTSALEGGWVFKDMPWLLCPGKDPVPIVQEVGLAPGPVWKAAENLAPHWDLSPGPSSP